MKCVFFDCETTGLPDYPGAEILQWALLGWDDGKRTPVVNETFRMLGNPEEPNAIEAMKINGYDYAKSSALQPLTALSVKAAFKMIADHDGYVVGCNPSFDVDFLFKHAKALGVPRPTVNGKPVRIRLIDVSSMAVPLMVAGKLPGIRLRDLGALLSPPRTQTEPHNAADDVTLTCDVFEALFVKYWNAIK